MRGTDRAFSHVPVVLDLQTDREICGRSELACQSQRSVECRGATSKLDTVPARARYIDDSGKPIDAEFHRVQGLFAQNHAWMY